MNFECEQLLKMNKLGLELGLLVRVMNTTASLFVMSSHSYTTEEDTASYHATGAILNHITSKLASGGYHKGINNNYKNDYYFCKIQIE